jgi:hypothetical protein
VTETPDGVPAEPERVSRGVRTIGSDLRVSGISLELDPNGVPSRVGGQVTVELRTDMWPYWLREAIDAAIAAAAAGDEIPALDARVEAGNATAEELDTLVESELIATMRAIGACAFAIDAFYAAVKARSPQHPDEAAWKANGTARHKQVTETIFYHLKIRNQATKTEIRQRVSKIYEFRDKAVHSSSDFKPPIYRPDLNVALDQAFSMFRRENAVMATGMTVNVIDYFVSFLQNGGDDLVEKKPGARKKMDALLDQYEAAGIFVPVVRREPPETAEPESHGGEATP